MARKLKVFGGTFDGCNWVDTKDRQTRGIVAAPSLTAALALFKAVSTYGYPRRQYCSETGNAAEIAAAMARPGVVLVMNRPPYHGSKAVEDFKTVEEWNAQIPELPAGSCTKLGSTCSEQFCMLKEGHDGPCNPVPF